MSAPADALEKRPARRAKPPAGRTRGRSPLQEQTPEIHAPEVREVWVAQFVYTADNGEMRVSMLTVEAASRDDARARAAAIAPSREFMLTLQRRSDEQFLGHVRHQVLASTRQG